MLKEFFFFFKAKELPKTLLLVFFLTRMFIGIFKYFPMSLNIVNMLLDGMANTDYIQTNLQ